MYVTIKSHMELFTLAIFTVLQKKSMNSCIHNNIWREIHVHSSNKLSHIPNLNPYTAKNAI